MAFSDNISLVSGIFQRIDTFPVDLYWNCLMDFQWHFPMEFHFCDFFCVIFRPEPTVRRRMRVSGPSRASMVPRDRGGGEPHWGGGRPRGHLHRSPRLSAKSPQKLHREMQNSWLAKFPGAKDCTPELTKMNIHWKK